MTSSLRERTSQSTTSRRLLAAATAGALCAATLLASQEASAQTAVTDAVSPDAKGVVGGALLGGEVVDLTLGIIGVNAGWPYLVFGGLGAVGGGIGGYFVEQSTRDVPEVSLYMLAGGMALVIPTIVVSLNATMYKPPEGTSSTTIEPADNQPATGPSPVQPPSPIQPATQTRRPTFRPVERREHLAFSLVDVYRGSLTVAMPAVDVRPLYSSREVWTYGVSQGTEVRIPVFHAAF